MKVRKATLKDLQKVKALNQELFYYDHNKFDSTMDTTWPSKNPDYYTKRIRGKNALVLVAEEEGKIIAYLIASLIKGESWKKIKEMAELENMMVIKEFRGHGIGTALIKEFITWAKSKGAKRAKVVASAQNNEAVAAYRKNAFEDYTLTLERKL